MALATYTQFVVYYCYNSLQQVQFTAQSKATSIQIAVLCCLTAVYKALLQNFCTLKYCKVITTFTSSSTKITVQYGCHRN